LTESNGLSLLPSDSLSSKKVKHGSSAQPYHYGSSTTAYEWDAACIEIDPCYTLSLHVVEGLSRGLTEEHLEDRTLAAWVSLRDGAFCAFARGRLNVSEELTWREEQEYELEIPIGKSG
jgi:hypothetical protein